MCFSGFPERRSVWFLHGSVQYAVGTHQVSGLADDFPAFYASVNRLRTAGQG